MNISFYGGAREVTGACYLLESGGTRILIDCGLFQGCEECPDENREPFPFDPKSIGALLVTHAHIDHIGRIPKLVREGFSGAIYSTAPTRDLARLLFEDALKVAEHDKKDPLYSPEDVGAALSLWQAREYRTSIPLGRNISAMFYDAGHILGSSMVEIEAEAKKTLFSGDMGSVSSTLLPDPEGAGAVDYLVIESTYGNRAHEPPEERIVRLERAVEDSCARSGTLLVPAFATERTQDILFLFNQMLHLRRIPEISVFVDAPLAIRVTEVFERYIGYYKKEIQELYGEHPHLFRFKKLKFTESVEESKTINAVPPPKVILAGSGMMTGGRVLHHAARYLPDKRNILLVMGYQGAGSLGRRLIDGAREVNILGRVIPVEAEVRMIKGFSAHADNPQLFSFIASRRDTLRRVFVVQGEEAQALHLMQEVRDRLGISADAPVKNQSFDL